jgi:4-hydroxythreonine-4-phosphate dehydrogenase
MTQKLRPLALTQGDPLGIGPEITLKAFCARYSAKLPPFFVVGAPDFYARTAKEQGLNVPVEIATPDIASDIFARALPVVPLPDNATGPAATIRSIAQAVEAVAQGSARAVVTNPIAKAVLYEAGFAHPGHTEFLGELSQRYFGAKTKPVMMLWSEELAVVPVTVHVALARAPQLLTQELLIETGRIVAHDLKTRFGVDSPRLAFAGLNPHAGEAGAMGREEIDVIAPAITALRAQGIDARGPFPADTLFHAAARGKYDVALCPTHDQALIPIKTLAFERAVNVTLGLPFFRASPDHGVAYDIAGQGVADPTSLIEAIRLAGRVSA